MKWAKWIIQNIAYTMVNQLLYRWLLCLKENIQDLIDDETIPLFDDSLKAPVHQASLKENMLETDVP